MIACALSAPADFIVSGDKDLYAFKTHQGIRIVSIAEALRLIAGA